MSWLDTPILMEDAVILSTSEQNLVKKLTIQCGHYSDYDKEINETKQRERT